MPFGTIPFHQRLGIGNATSSDVSRFALYVMKMALDNLDTPPYPMNGWYNDLANMRIPIYQQCLAHSTNNAEGGPGSADSCNYADSEKSNTNIIREVMPGDTQYGKRNIYNSSQFRLLTNPQNGNGIVHSNAYSNQIYYFMNEPDGHSQYDAPSDCQCTDPSTRALDEWLRSALTAAGINFTNFEANNGLGFWSPGGVKDRVDCGPLSSSNTSNVNWNNMAGVFLKLKKIIEMIPNKSHCLLPPAPAYDGGDYATYALIINYYGTFFNQVHGLSPVQPPLIDAPIIPKAEISKMKVFHLHAYLKPNGPQGVDVDPILAVNTTANRVVNTVNWYRQSYSNNLSKLPLDVLISETTFIDAWAKQANSPKAWTGQCSGFLKSLQAWNAWLSWLTRNGPASCNLQNTGVDNGIETYNPTTGIYIGDKTIHTCLHEPSVPPYTTPEPANGQSNWSFVNLNNGGYADYAYSQPTFTFSTTDTADTSMYPFRTAFTYNSTNHSNANWCLAPLGACYSVWSKVGPRGVTGNLNNGWIHASQSYNPYYANIQVPHIGFFTVYFPVIRASSGNIGFNPRINLSWQVPGFPRIYTGSLAAKLLPVYNNGMIAPSMVYPILCYSTQERTVSISMQTDFSSNGFYFGKPIVLPVKCTWSEIN